MVGQQEIGGHGGGLRGLEVQGSRVDGPHPGGRETSELPQEDKLHGVCNL